MSARGLNETHDPALRSFVASANGATEFPIQNLPFGVFRRSGEPETAARGGVAIGDAIVDLAMLHTSRAFSGDAAEALAHAARAPLNDFAALGNDAAGAVRTALSRALRDDARMRSVMEAALVPQAEATMSLPVRVGDYTDFYASRYHAYAVGALFRPEEPLFPNYAWVPIGYHGRASSVVVSGTPIVRPNGQMLPPGASEPIFGPTRALDFEVELGLVIGRGNELGRPIAIDGAEDHLFGMVVLNDWSARDMQSWEYRPLGPFLGKSFATTISPWIVTVEALAPYRTALRRPADQPTPLAYLQATDASTFDVGVSVALASRAMRERGLAPTLLSRSSLSDAFWTPSQLVTHHASNGCNLRPGDLLGTGTLSGPSPENAGSLLELTRGGRAALALTGDHARTYLEEGDEVSVGARCVRSGAATCGFGTATGEIAPS